MNCKKEKYVFLLYEHRDRELESCIRIAHCLKQQSNITSLIFSISFEVTRTIKAFYRYYPVAVVVPWAYTDIFVKEFSPMFFTNKCPFIISLDCEQIYSKFNKLRYCPANEYSKERIIHCAWGQNYADLLVRHGANKKNVVITGCPRVDILLDKKSVSKDEAKKKLGDEFELNNNKKWMLFAESRALSYSEDYIKKYENYGIPAEENRKRVQAYIDSLKLMIESLKNMKDSFFEEYEFIYRAHPGQDICDDIDSRIKIIAKYSLYDWFPAIDILVSFNSSSLYEAQAFGLPVVRYNSANVNPAYLCIGIEKLESIDDFSELEEVDLSQYRIYNNYKNYLGNADGHSVERIGNLISTVVNGDYKSYDPNINKSRITYLTIRRIIAESVFRILVYFKGPEGLRKFPSYKIRRDLPESYRIRKRLRKKDGRL